MERYKARLVAKGFNQVHGVYIFETFSRMAKIVTVRTFIAIGAAKQWPIHQIEINNAYLYCYVEEDLYMLPP